MTLEAGLGLLTLVLLVLAVWLWNRPGKAPKAEDLHTSGELDRSLLKLTGDDDLDRK